jgi:regulator of cell morphogenesis and NO signaling
MTIADRTLADLVASDASRARVLDGLGLDFCCNGDETLDRACVRMGLEVSDVIARLDAPGPEGHDHDCSRMGPAELIGHLVDVHHAYLHAELPDLERIAQKVVAEHGGRHPELPDVQMLFGALYEELEPHMVREERVLFPAILELVNGPAVFPFGSIANPIEMMGIEHDRAGELLARLRVTTGDYLVPADACASYRSLYERLAELERDTHLHIFEENHLLFPQAAALPPG